MIHWIKKTCFAVNLGAILLSCQSAQAHTSVEFRKVKSGGTMKWLGNTIMPCGLPNDQGCRVTVSSPQGSGLVASSGTGHIIETVVNGIVFENISAETQYTADGAYFTFGDDYEICVTHSDEYPQLIGRQVSLNGLTANSQGIITVYVP